MKVIIGKSRENIPHKNRTVKKFHKFKVTPLRFLVKIRYTSCRGDIVTTAKLCCAQISEVLAHISFMWGNVTLKLLVKVF